MHGGFTSENKFNPFFPLEIKYVAEEEDPPPLKPYLLLLYSVWVVHSERPGGHGNDHSCGTGNSH